MAEPLSVRDMDEIDFQRRDWVLERIGRAGVTAFLLAAALGVFGAGPVSQRTAEAADGSVRVEYQRFIRQIGSTDLTITPGTVSARGDSLTVRVSRNLSDAWQVRTVTPTPSTESSDADWLIWEFDVLGDTPPTVKVVYSGDGLGGHSGAVRAGDGQPLHLSQWVYP